MGIDRFRRTAVGADLQTKRQTMPHTVFDLDLPLPLCIWLKKKETVAIGPANYIIISDRLNRPTLQTKFYDQQASYL